MAIAVLSKYFEKVEQEKYLEKNTCCDIIDSIYLFVPLVWLVNTQSIDRLISPNK